VPLFEGEFEDTKEVFRIRISKKKKKKKKKKRQHNCQKKMNKGTNNDLQSKQTCGVWVGIIARLILYDVIFV
jgi:hypothetical protein